MNRHRILLTLHKLLGYIITSIIKGARAQSLQLQIALLISFLHIKTLV